MKSLLEEFSDNNFLVTTENWFIAPNGKQYKAAWGKVEIHSSEKTLGVKTNAKSTNWYAIVGEGAKRVIIAGCQIHYACVSMGKPNIEDCEEYKFVDSVQKNIPYSYRTMIYLAQ